MAGHLTRFLSELVLDLDRPLADVPLMPEAEREALAAWNRTDAQYPAGTCVHELFDAQAARTPDAVAAVFEDQELTYAELDRRSNRLGPPAARARDPRRRASPASAWTAPSI